ncbi:MAG: hypothetical protein LW650_05955 [Planctomycetaceae bacterium]|jgi:hypothetical protein|nr:hypothetical protein [Planctomycetaceae bacterium]
MKRDSNVILLAVAVIVVGLGASCLLAVQIAASAGRHQLVYTDRAEEGITPEEALGIAAGAFRGVVVNFLWIRAQELKQDGKHYEAVDLAKTITRLQPRFPRVWAFHAWNLAYNISVATQTPGERWQWVNAGIRLLRDQGIPANPSDMLLHRELAWIFLHKIQGMADDANGHYKRAMAYEWTIVLGPPPTRTAENRDTAKAIADHVEWLTRIAEGPDTLAAVIDREAAWAAEQKVQPTARELIDRLRDAGMDPARPENRMLLLNIREQQRAALLRATALNAQGRLQGVDERVLATLMEAKYAEAWAQLARHLRKRMLIDDYHYEPARMIRYTQRFGPLDWRHPASHALYWSTRGVEQSLDRLNESNEQNLDFINTDRLTVQSLQELFRSGTLLYDVLAPDMYLAMPSADYIASYGDYLKEASERETSQFMAQKGVDVTQRVWTMYRAGYENFLSDAIAFLYRLGRKEEAREYQLKLAAWPYRVRNDIMRDEELRAPLEEFVVAQIRDRITSPNIALMEISGALYSAYANGLLRGDEDLFRSNFEYARRFHAEFVREQARRTPAGGEIDRMLAQLSGRFENVAGQLFAGILGQCPPAEAGTMFRRAPADLQAIAWDVLDQFRPRDEQGKAVDSGFEVVFPMPDGVKAIRAAREAEETRQRIQRGTIEQR